MTRNEFLRRFPRASESAVRKNCAEDPGQIAVMELHPRPEPLATGKIQKTHSDRVLVRIVSARKRLIDPDNLCQKFLVDCCRYCSAIPGDEPDKLTLETTQRKVEPGEEEHTEIEITIINDPLKG